MSLRKTSWVLLLLGAACTDSVGVKVQVVNPCNQDALGSADFLRLEPRGDGIDSAALTTVQPRGASSSQALEIPLASNFQVLATGHAPSFVPEDILALGLSGSVDLSEAEDEVELSLMMSLLGSFHRTTNALNPAACTSMNEGRHDATATQLDNGMVLIVGGVRYVIDEGGRQAREFVRGVEVYDPSTGTFLAGPPGTERRWLLPTSQVRRNHSASLLPDGRVLIAGGQRPLLNPEVEEPLQSAFILDPRDLGAMALPEQALPMVVARTQHRAAVLGDGRVVLVGGVTADLDERRPEFQTYTDSIESFSVREFIFRKATNLNGNEVRLQTARAAHSATALATTDVVIAGGMNRAGPVLSLEVLRFEGDVVERVTGSQNLSVGPIDHSAALTQDGGVVLSGGFGRLSDIRGPLRQNSVSGVEMWAVDPATGEARRVCTGNMTGQRGDHTTSVLGRWALFSGGRDAAGQPRADADLAQLKTAADAAEGNCFEAASEIVSMATARAEHQAVSLRASGEVLVLGGVELDANPQFPGQSTATAEIFSGFARSLILAPQPRP